MDANRKFEVNMKIRRYFVAIAIFTLFSSKIGMAAQPLSTPARVVSPRALITQVEIAEYRRTIRNAPTREAAQAIREATYANLRQRAADRGMIMAEPQPWYGGLHWGEIAHTKETTPRTTAHAPEKKPAVLPHEHPVPPRVH
jgi:hypothetical protein